MWGLDPGKSKFLKIFTKLDKGLILAQEVLCFYCLRYISLVFTTTNRPRNTSLQKNFRDSLKKPLAALPLLLLLASCGGGSGGSGGVSGGSGGSGVLVGSGGFDPLPPSGPAPARVSKIKPRPGSVTQSSNPTDKISIEVIQAESSNNSSSANNSNNSPPSETTTDNSTAVMAPPSETTIPNNPYLQDSEVMYIRNSNKWTAKFTGTSKNIGPYCVDVLYLCDGKIYEDFFLKFSNDIWTVSESPNNVGFGWLANKVGYTNTDYLLLGHWIETNSNPTHISDLLNVGVFVDGSDPFTSPVSSITGKATYSGPIRILPYNTNEDYHAALPSCFLAGNCYSIEEGQQIVNADIKGTTKNRKSQK